MSVNCQASYLPQDTLFWNLYSTMKSVAQKAQEEVRPTAPPMDEIDLITWFLRRDIKYEWPLDELDQMNTLWRKITGVEISDYLNSDINISELIQVLQFRETELVRMYSTSGSNETTISRTEMMEFHAKFFNDYGCRITDFQNNESFLFLVETHIQCQFV